MAEVVFRNYSAGVPMAPGRREIIIAAVLDRPLTEHGRQPVLRPATTSRWPFQRAPISPRRYLIVSSDEPLAAAAAFWAWADGAPDLCVTSPSRTAHDTAVFACAGHFVRIVDEPLLAVREHGESTADFAFRFARALGTLLACDVGAALVVCDDVPAHWTTPLAEDDSGLRRRRTALLDQRLPLAP